MILVQATAKGVQKLTRDLAAERKRHDKAMQTAVRVRGFKLMQLLRKEIRAGAPGGRRFAPLSMMRRIMRAQFSKTGRLGADKPLATLAKSVGYEKDLIVNGQYAVRLGFGLATVVKLNSASWRRIAKMHQEGFTASTSAPFFRKHNISIEQYLRQVGSEVDHKTFGGRKTRRRNVFFLKKSTQTLRTPAREIIDPFIAAHRTEALAKIRRDFIIKLRGGRI